MIELPTHRWPSICDPDGVDMVHLRDWVYPGLFVGSDASEEELALQQSRMADAAWLGERTILAPRNRAVDELNSSMITAFPGDEMECLSADVVKEGTVATEFLNGIELPNFPQHHLVLKRFMPLVLLRNLSPPDGLCNGTRLILLDVRHNGRLLVCRIATGTHVGETVEIPRVTLDADEDAFPFKWSRRQFPVRYSCAAVSCSHRVLVFAPNSLLQPAHSFVPVEHVSSSYSCLSHMYRCVLPLLLQSTSLRAKHSNVWAYTSSIPASPMASCTSRHLALVPRRTSDSRFRGMRSRVHFAHATLYFLKC